MAIAERALRFTPLADLRSDRSLVRAAQAGRREAVSLLIERYYSRVRSFVSYLTNGAANSEDLTQEVFTRALAAIGRFNGNYRFGPWLFRIAKNLCVDEARRNNFRPEPADPSELPLLERAPSPSDYVWETVASQFASSIVRKALDQLGWRQRAALVLKEIEGMSYAEIAEVIGTNVRGVEATLRRAKANFRLAVGRAEQADTEKASCVRTLRLLANDPGRVLEARGHLRVCRECRSKASSIRSADKLLGLVSPVAFGSPIWKSQLAAHVAHRSGGSRRSFMEILRGHPSVGFASPIAQVAQFATSLTLAASVSVASVSGVARVVSVAGGPEAVVSAPAVAAVDEEAAARSASVDTTPSASTPAQAEPSPSATQELVNGLDGALASAASGLSIASLKSAATSLPEAIGELPIVPGQQEKGSEGPVAPAAVLPAPVAMPRRRPTIERRTPLF